MVDHDSAPLLRGNAPFIRLVHCPLMAHDAYSLPPDLRKALTGELQAGERVLYASQPDWRAEWGTLLAILVFGIFWSAISFLFFGMSLAGLLGLAPVKSNGQPADTGLMLFMFLFSLPFVAIGLAMLTAPLFSIRKSRNTAHAVTDARLLNVYVGRDKGAESYPLSKVNFVKRRERRDGTGNLSIGYGVEKDSDGDPRPLTTEWPGIRDAKRAETILREQAKWVR